MVLERDDIAALCHQYLSSVGMEVPTEIRHQVAQVVAHAAQLGKDHKKLQIEGQTLRAHQQEAVRELQEKRKEVCFPSFQSLFPTHVMAAALIDDCRQNPLPNGYMPCDAPSWYCTHSQTMAAYGFSHVTMHAAVTVLRGDLGGTRPVTSLRHPKATSFRSSFFFFRRTAGATTFRLVRCFGRLMCLAEFPVLFVVRRQHFFLEMPRI